MSNPSSPLPLVCNLINSEFSITRSTFLKPDPYGVLPPRAVCDSEPIDFVKAIQPAQKAFAEWKLTTHAERNQFLIQLQKLITERSHDLILASGQDQGLPLHFVKKAEYDVALQIISVLQNELLSEPVSLADFSSPLGVTGFIFSSNLPLRLFVSHALRSLLAGNAVIIKFSSNTADFVRVLSEIVIGLKIPKGLIQFLNGQSMAFKNFFVSHPGLKSLSVIAGHATLAQIHHQISPQFSQNFKKIQFFGGSKNAAIVLKDVDQTQIDDILDSFLYGQGQLHWNCSRLFVLDKNLELWIAAINDKLSQLKISESIEDSSPWTPVLTDQSKSNYSEILNLAVADQAKLIRSVDSKKLRFLPPVFTQDMSNCSTLQQDQVSTPFYILSSVKYPFDIPKYANVSYYGDAASVWIDTSKKSKVVDDLEVANVALNRWAIFDAETRPGVKQSFYGNPDQRIFGSFFSNVKKMT